MLLCALRTLSLSVSVTYISKRWLALQSYSVCRLQLSKRLLVGQAGIWKFFSAPLCLLHWPCVGLLLVEEVWVFLAGGTGRSWKASVMSLWVHAFTAWGRWLMFFWLTMSNFRGHTPASLSRGCMCWRVSFGLVHWLETWCLICMFTRITVYTVLYVVVLKFCMRHFYSDWMFRWLFRFHLKAWIVPYKQWMVFQMIWS